MSSSIRVLIVVSFNVNTCAGIHWVNTGIGYFCVKTCRKRPKGVAEGGKFLLVRG